MCIVCVLLRPRFGRSNLWKHGHRCGMKIGKNLQGTAGQAASRGLNSRAVFSSKGAPRRGALNEKSPCGGWLRRTGFGSALLSGSLCCLLLRLRPHPKRRCTDSGICGMMAPLGAAAVARLGATRFGGYGLGRMLKRSFTAVCLARQT